METTLTLSFIVVMLVGTILAFIDFAKQAKERKKEQKKALGQQNRLIQSHDEYVAATKKLVKTLSEWNRETENMRHWMNETIQALDKCNEALKRNEAREIERNGERKRIQRLIKQAHGEPFVTLSESELAAISEHKGAKR